MTQPALGATFTATAQFLDDTETERAVDSVVWSETGGVTLNPSNSNVVTGKYTGTGAFELDAVGKTAGAPDVSLKVGGTVPVPFPTHGLIVIS